MKNNNDENYFKDIYNECLGYKAVLPPHGTRTCLDVGCNVGAFVEATKDNIEQFYCIDAGSENIMQFKERHKDLIHSNKVDVLNKACASETNKIVKLRPHVSNTGVVSNSGSLSTIDFTYENGDGWSDASEYEEVETISLEDLTEQALSFFETDEIDLLKIDIEGSEYDFLYGHDLSKFRLIIGEFHNFLSFLPCKENKDVNQRWSLFEYIEKTHNIVVTNSKSPRWFGDLVSPPIPQDSAYFWIDRHVINRVNDNNLEHTTCAFLRKDYCSDTFKDGMLDVLLKDPLLDLGEVD